MGRTLLEDCSKFSLPNTPVATGRQERTTRPAISHAISSTIIHAGRSPASPLGGSCRGYNSNASSRLTRHGVRWMFPASYRFVQTAMRFYRKLTYSRDRRRDVHGEPLAEFTRTASKKHPPTAAFFRTPCGLFPRPCRKFSRPCGEISRLCGTIWRLCGKILPAPRGFRQP